LDGLAVEKNNGLFQQPLHHQPAIQQQQQQSTITNKLSKLLLSNFRLTSSFSEVAEKKKEHQL